MPRRGKGKPDPLRDHPEKSLKRNRVNAHNGMLGGCYMAKSIMRNITNADSTTAISKRYAGSIHRLVDELILLMKERVDK